MGCAIVYSMLPNFQTGLTSYSTLLSSPHAGTACAPHMHSFIAGYQLGAATQSVLGANCSLNHVSVVQLPELLAPPWAFADCSFVPPAVLRCAVLCHVFWPGAAYDHSPLRPPQQPAQQGG